MANSGPPTPPKTPLPVEVTSRMVDNGRVLARSMTRRLVREIPLPKEFQRIEYMRLVAAACRDGLTIFVRRLHEGGSVDARDLARLGNAGAQQAEMGVPLEVLLSAYRLAAKVVWEEVIASSVLEANVPPDAMVAATAQVLEYLDDVSLAVGGAYLATRERLLRQQEREREHVIRRLVTGDAPLDLKRAAARCNLEFVPPYDCLAIVSPDVEVDGLLANLLPADVLHVATAPNRWIVLTPSSRPSLRLAERAVAAAKKRGMRISIGIAKGADTLEKVAAVAQAAERTLEAGLRLVPERSIFHRADMGVFAALVDAPEDAAAFIDELLGPLVTEDSTRNDTLLDTLEAALTEPSIAKAATRLGIHRHTMVYRMQRIRDVLPCNPDNPVDAHRLWLALQLRRLSQGHGVAPATPSSQ